MNRLARLSTLLLAPLLALAALAGCARAEPLVSVSVLDLDRGETMPQKSTYFYPKLLSGLLFLPV